MKINIKIIMLCLSFLAINYGCERTDLQNSTPSDSEKIVVRGPCDNCVTLGDCCSAITLISAPSGDHEFSICGTTDGDAVECEIPQTDCSVPIDGLQHSSFLLNISGTTLHIFCDAEDTGFAISHLSGGNVTIVLTCQFGQINAQTLNISFNGMERKEFEIDDNCVVSECT